jgi:hypothetical protein
VNAAPCTVTCIDVTVEVPGRVLVADLRLDVPGGTLLVAVSRVAPAAQLGRESPLFAPK